MKRLFIFVCLSFFALSLHARAIQEDYKNAEEKARTSYAFGMVLGFNLSEAGEIDFDYNALIEGIKAVTENTETQFTEQEAFEIVQNALYASMEGVAETNRISEQEFLITNSQRPEVLITESGLQYEIIIETDGDKPSADSVVRVNYVGTFTDGKFFDSSDDDGSYIPLEYVIQGWTEGLLLMSIGSKYIFYIPSNLAYGRDGIPSVIPPYSTLIFSVDLLEIVENDSSLFDF